MWVQTRGQCPIVRFTNLEEIKPIELVHLPDNSCSGIRHTILGCKWHICTIIHVDGQSAVAAIVFSRKWPLPCPACSVQWWVHGVHMQNRVLARIKAFFQDPMTVYFNSCYERVCISQTIRKDDNCNCVTVLWPSTSWHYTTPFDNITSKEPANLIYTDA